MASSGRPGVSGDGERAPPFSATLPTSSRHPPTPAARPTSLTGESPSRSTAPSSHVCSSAFSSLSSRLLPVTRPLWAGKVFDSLPHLFGLSVLKRPSPLPRLLCPPSPCEVLHSQPAESGHHEDLEAAEELGLCAPRSLRVVLSVHGNRKR